MKNKNLIKTLPKGIGSDNSFKPKPSCSSAIDVFLREVKKDTDVLAVILYGSAADKTQTPGSDVDVCLLLDPDKKISAAERFKKRIYYLGRFDFDVRIFSELPLYIRQRILRDGKILFSREEDKLYDIAFKTITEFADFEHGYREYLEETANA